MRYSAAWGCVLIGVAVLGVLAFGLDALPALLLAGAGVGAIVVPALVTLPRDVEAPDTSGAMLLMAFGANCALVGLALGQAFLWPGLGLLVLGAIVEATR